MTKLQLLHRALNERLMAAVEQIMEMVGGTVLEYEEETVRARKENEILRRRLRWMEGENPTDWPDPTDFSVPGEASLADTLALESLIIKTEPIDPSDFQLYGPDTSLTASVCTDNMEMVHPGTSASAAAGIPDGTVWDSAQSYMAPLDFDPTMSTMARNRSQRRSFACPDCGKVFAREQRLMFHMRVHSGERPYTYRRRKTCFYGDKKRKKKFRGLSKTSREFIEDLSDSSEQTEKSTGSANVGVSKRVGPASAEVEPSEVSDETSEHTSSSKLSETSVARPVGLKAKQGREKPKTTQCLQCNKAFTNVSRLAVHMKTHRKPLPSQDEQNVQGDRDATDSGSQHLPKAIRNNETEVEKAKAIGQRLFQCPECKKIFARSCWLTFHLKSHERERKRQKKKQLQNKNAKDALRVSEEPRKEVATESSKVPVLKKIFACPYCDKVFAREGWLAPHIRSHTIKQQKSDIISDAILPNSTKRRSRRVVTQPSSESSSEEKKITEQSLGEIEDSDLVDELLNNETSVPKNIPTELITNPETQIIISNNAEDISIESQSISNKTETIPNKIAEDSTLVPDDSPGQKEAVKKSKKRFPCRECGKVYLLAGWLKTHKKMHKKERILEENRRQLMMMSEFGQNDNKEGGQSLVETNIEKKQKKKKKTLALQDNLVDKKKKKNQLTNEVLLQNMDNTSDVQTDADKSEESATRGRCVCKDCGKVYARKNWLSLHMLGHRKALMAIPQKSNDEALKSDGQTAQEGSSTKDSKGQKGKDGGKASFPCPFCDKVFPRAMRLMVHMQIHSGEKPYSYRQRKEQFYTDLTRPRVPDTDKQEPAVEGNDEKGNDGGGEVTRNQTSAVSQGHASATEPLETVQPQSVCTGRKFNLHHLQSSGAATIHSTTLTRTDTKSDSNFSLQPRIVLDPVIAESSHSASSERGDFKPITVETSDIQLHQMRDLETNNAATGEQVMSHLAPFENTNLYASQNTVTETDHPAVVHVKIGSIHKYPENRCSSEKLLVSIGAQQTSETESPDHRKAEICKKKGQVEIQEYSLLDVKQHKVPCDPELLKMDRESQQSGSQIHTYGKSSFFGIVKAKNISPHSEYQKHDIDQACSSDKRKSTDISLITVPEFESSSNAIHQVSHTESGYMILSDVSDDDEWANMSDNSDEKKEKIPLKISNPLPEGLSDTGSIPGSSHAASDPDGTMLEKTGEQNYLDGTLHNRDEMAANSVQQTEEPSSTGQTKWCSCLACGLKFAGEASLTKHMRVHSVSAVTYQKPNDYKTLKKKVKNNEKKIKQQVVQVQTSKVGSADSRDNSEISGKSDSTLVNVNAAKLSGCPDIGATSRSSRADSKNRKTKKGKKALRCCYCGKACKKIELHLMHDHPKEPKVLEALHFSNKVEERKRLLSLLCSKKTQKHEYATRNIQEEDLVHCIFCQGYYQRNQFWKHALICEQKQPKQSILAKPGRSTDLSSTSLRSRPSLAQKAFDPECGNLIKGTSCNTVQPSSPESVNLSLLKAETHTTHHLYYVSPVSQTGSTDINPVPDQGSESLSILYTDNSTATRILDSETSGTLILDSLHSALEYSCAPLQESCPSTVHHVLVENQKLTDLPLTAKAISGKQNQSTLEPENRLSLLDTMTSDLQHTNQDLQTFSMQTSDCREKYVIPHEVSHIFTESSDFQPTTDLKSDWTTTPTLDLKQHFGSDAREPERTAVVMAELVSERNAQSHPHLESTECLVANIYSIESQKTPNVQVCGKDEHRAPDTESHCHLIPTQIPTETYSAAQKLFDSEGQIRDDINEGGNCTGSKRRQDTWSRDTKRRRQSDPLQTSTDEREALPVTSQIPEMKYGLQISDVWTSSKSSKGKATLKLKKKQYCVYCKKPSIHMTQHLLSAHATEPEVVKALSYDKKSKERKQLLDLLLSKGNLLHRDVGMSITSSEDLLPVNQEGDPNSNKSQCRAKQDHPNPESECSHVSDTGHSATKSSGSPCEDVGIVSEQLFADLGSQSYLSPDTSLDRNDHVGSSPAYDQTVTSEKEDKKTEAEQQPSSQSLHRVENRRRSSRIQAQPMRVMDSHSDDAKSMSQSSKPHTCQHCSATFCSHYHLRRHEYTHTDERPYWCNQCNIGFIQKYRYRNHKITHHENRQSSKSKDPSRMCKKQSHVEEKPTENFHEKQSDDSTAATSEERPDLTDKETGDLKEFNDE
ncbi:uncharacterized protein zgc:66474 isoform X2 [Silurus meridionalis]|uniref:uncharacterized protein zgc:66474 isoform X2 n=1 Tax=Silurus meridionalis TaxID=175797 RepID=UPI001EECA459|nr:uncharacterized protein zgc:66474 isoform X2 [Silurus meridionalis]